ncbi:hypothetical protein LCGC14_1270350 [marine sediment metagenome]|uniref:J domain-containing protein n=1 Tax=marine sediment metagenome TaxID=412755 RepID=A0A0F9KYC0_9ZZZZ
MTRKRAGGAAVVNIIDTDKAVTDTLTDLRRLFIDWAIEDWEPFPDGSGPGYTVRFLRGKTWTAIGSSLQPTRAQNLRVCYVVVHNMKIWGERGITGVAQGVQFVGGLIPTGQDADKESYEVACVVLGVEPDASFEEVKRVYQAKVQFVHPDKGGDEERFKRLQKAYEHVAKVKGQKP